jgi:hypothetical protein
MHRKETEMATLKIAEQVEARAGTVLIRSLVVGFAFATAAIHASLGGLLFLANAIGYTTLALLMVAPGQIGRVRWLVRLALLGFTAATIGGWALFGARFPLAYLDKGIELALISAVALELWRTDGGPIGVARRAGRLVAGLVGTQRAKAPQ